ncbi:MAG TPA: sugar ABC transporter permease [Streptosporangiales bacterium]
MARVRSLETRDRLLGYGMVAPAVVVLLLITAFPLFYNLWNSFHHVDLLDPTTLGSGAGLGNYVQVFTGATFVPSLARTAAFTVVSVAIELAVGLAMAVVLNRPFPGRGVVRAAIFVPWAVPTVVSAMMWKTMFDPRQGFVDYVLGALHLPGGGTTWLAGTWTAWTAVFVADAWKNVPFMTILLLAGLQVLPRELYESSRIDGASPWQAFTRITLPLLKPALMVALVFRTLQAFLVFDVVYIMTGGGPGSSTETVSFLNWRAFLVDSDFGYGGAVSVVMVVIALLIAGVYVRFVRPEAVG